MYGISLHTLHVVKNNKKYFKKLFWKMEKRVLTF